MDEHTVTLHGTGTCDCHVELWCSCQWIERLPSPTPGEVWRAEQEHLSTVAARDRRSLHGTLAYPKEIDDIQHST